MQFTWLANGVRGRLENGQGAVEIHRHEPTNNRLQQFRSHVTRTIDPGRLDFDRHGLQFAKFRAISNPSKCPNKAGNKTWARNSKPVVGGFSSPGAAYNCGL
jgi:hypothetical protein